MRGVVTALIVMTVALLAACTPTVTTGPRPLTDEEAQLLAVVRLNNLREGTRAVTVDVPTEVALTGWADFEQHLGYGALVNPDASPAGLVSWNLGEIAFHDADGSDLDGTAPPLPAPADGWTTQALDPASSKIAACLLIVLNLADDRAENYTLLQQEGAQWMRDATLDGGAGKVDVQVMRGPTSGGGAVLDYWVDADGLLLRLDIDFGDPDLTVITFGDAGGVTVPALPAG